MKHYSQLSIPTQEQFYFGHAPKPVSTRRGLVIGDGKVYPEINLTLPPIQINQANFDEIKKMYAETLTEICKRAVELDFEGFVIEFETLIEMTTHPPFAIELTEILNNILERFYAQNGLKTAIRITPNDSREMLRPPFMRSGRYYESMLKTFEGCAQNGAEFLAIESTGGKELHDQALLMCDLEMVVFSMICLGCRDMEFLWNKIVQIALKTNTIPSGDTACGFANTAMVLAEKKCIPKIFAAVVRVISAVRSLVAYDQGAVGPGKDCGYENVFIKAITGAPMAMEGRMASCAHLSPLGNIAGAVCDLWSNESVQMIKLLGGLAPVVSIEQLIYDCRMMNLSIEKNQHLMLRDLLVESDMWHDPQALVLAPENVIAISRKIISAKSYYAAAIAGAKEALNIIEKALNEGKLKVSEIELPWTAMLQSTLANLPSSEEKFIDMMMPRADASKIRIEEYGLK
jgi:methanol---5-hydroxybenzimidazolylcobamide Co-methyltransferase